VWYLFGLESEACNVKHTKLSNKEIADATPSVEHKPLLKQIVTSTITIADTAKDLLLFFGVVELKWNLVI